jgi:hypothetical protein
MRSALRSLPLVPLAAAALAWTPDGHAQAVVADYGFSRSGTGMVRLDAPYPATTFNLGSLLIVPTLQAGTRVSAAGLSFQAGLNWFGQVGLGRSLEPGPAPSGAEAADVLSIMGGYRWSDARSLSLQLSRPRGGDRLGLTANYDWPRYFVRLDYDTGLKPLQQDNLRFSAGMRF